ncbi:hypothetical protein NP493_396g02000 [Ridgeia piscesae]|uniref:Uncharacterized protein n=1 Tax=Ridgeia piscesae TaxID=27915 RepID=A0AAD9L1V1_RIDPI|nr:hypothetical protein NP493_396g02000 [Ridgeia piscesae]
MDVVHNYSVMTLALGIGYAAYYWLYIAKRPMLAGNVKWQNFIHSHCPLICSRFMPTFWEFLDLSDGGHVSLDWLVTEVPEDTPVVLILPGLIGNGDQSYALHLQKQVQNVGYRSVVFSYRGNGGAHLKTARTYTACETGDLASVVHHIKLCYPNAPLVAVGVPPCLNRCLTWTTYSSNFTEYYNDARIDTKVHNIEIPLLALNSTDDPFSPASASESKCVVIVATSHGGHIGFLEGLLPTGPGYMDRVFAEYISAICQHGEELQANLHETE